MNHEPLPISTIPWARPPTEHSKLELGQYLFTLARMQSMRVRLIVPVEVAVSRGAELTEELLDSAWVPAALAQKPVFVWRPLERYLTFIAQAYGEVLCVAVLPEPDRRFEASWTDYPAKRNALLYSITRPIRRIAVHC